MPKGVYERSSYDKERLTNQLRAIDTSSLLGVPKTSRKTGLPLRLSEDAKLESLRAARRKNARTYKGRYQHLLSTAKKTNREVEVSSEELEEIRKHPCKYCGGPLPVCGHGLDRLDNTKGYVKTNIAPCCGSCNQKKGRLEQIGFKFPRTVELILELMNHVR